MHHALLLSMVLALMPLMFLSCDGGGGCHDGVDVSADVVVQSARLVSDTPETCVIRGTLANNSDVTVDVVLVFQVFEVDGKQAEFAGAREFNVPAHSKEPYETNAIYQPAERFPVFLPCSRIGRFELVSGRAATRICTGIRL